MSRNKVFLLDIFLLHMILLGCLYFISLAVTLYKLTGIKFRPFTIFHCLSIYLHFQKLYED